MLDGWTLANMPESSAGLWVCNRSDLIVQEPIKPACYLKWTNVRTYNAHDVVAENKTLAGRRPGLLLQARCEHAAAVWNQYVIAIVTLNFPSAAVCWSHSAAAAAADACTYHVLPGVTQVTSLWHAPCTETLPAEDKPSTLPIEPAGRPSSLNKQWSLLQTVCAIGCIFVVTSSSEGGEMRGRGGAATVTRWGIWRRAEWMEVTSSRFVLQVCPLHCRKWTVLI